MEKATRHQTRDHNSRLVLRTIYSASPISRAEIARQTGLTRPTVSALVANLLESDLVVETGQGPSAGGKPPTLVAFNGRGHALLALDLSGRDFHAAVVNLDGQVLRQATLPRSQRADGAVLDQVYGLIDALLPEVEPSPLAIGVATPGLVDPDRGIVLRSVNLGWVNVPLRDRLAGRYGLPVHVANDSHMAALAEFTYGEVRGGDNLIVVRVGQGTGAGVILDSRPFYGDGFGAGEIGHVVVDPAGELCSCGNHGCLETTSSIPAILRNATAADREQSALAGAEALTWERFVAAVRSHDPVAADVAVRAGCHLGAAVAHLVGAYNIQTIVLAGPIADLGDVLLDAVTAEMHQRVLPAMAATTTVRYPSIRPAQLPEIIMLGCSALVIHRELGII